MEGMNNMCSMFNGGVPNTEPLETNDKPYHLRKLCAKDIFPFVKILSKVGVKQFADCFKAEDDGISVEIAGMDAALGIVDILLCNLDQCENEIYRFLAGVADTSADEIMNLDLNIFMDMIMEIVHKREFTDFFNHVSRLLGLVD